MFNNSSSEASSDSRMAVADILSSMASGESANVTNFTTFGGYTCGIPTKTTPTLTPTTLRNIEDFIELQSVPPEPIKHQHQAGFVPPLVSVQNSTANSAILDRSDSENSLDERSLTMSGDFQQPRRSGRKSGRMGGRRPNNDIHLTPEEAERREVRRERNKQAAARCRKRRLDHTNVLIEETEALEDKRQSLQNEIQMLEYQKEELRFILEAHKATCRIGNQLEELDIKPIVPPPCSEVNLQTNMPRPNSLPVSSNFVSQNPSVTMNSSVIRIPSSQSISDIAGISITTPSAGIFNFDSYMEGGTGLTPVSSSGLVTPVVPSCSTQQRNSSSDMSSPDTVNPPKLVSL